MALRIYKRGLIASSFRKVIPRTSIQEAAYGATLLLLLMLDGARESGIKKRNMAHFINCSSCGKQYNKDAFDECPFCGFSSNPKNKKESEKKASIPTLSGWHSFATFIMVLSGIGLLVFCFLIPSVTAETPFGGTIMIFLLPILISNFIFTLLICAIVQLLSGIKMDTDTLRKDDFK